MVLHSQVAWTFLGDHLSIHHHPTKLRVLNVGDYVLYNAVAADTFNKVEKSTGYQFEGEALGLSVAKVVALRRTGPDTGSDTDASFQCVGIEFFWRRGQIFAESDVLGYPFLWSAEVFSHADAETEWVSVTAIERIVQVLPYHEVKDLQAYEEGAYDAALKDRTRFWFRYTYHGSAGAHFAFTSAHVKPAYIDPARKGKDLYMLDACAGMGTVSMGARAAGLVPSHFVEVDKTACDSVTLNFDQPSGVSYPLLESRLDLRGFVKLV